MAKKTNIRFSFRVYKGDVPFLGPGRVQLMEGILKHGSIAKAAKDMGMSYRKAWQLVKDINAIAEKPLVEKRLGGKYGGGAAVTPAGERAIKSYYKLRQKADHFFSSSITKTDF